MDREIFLATDEDLMIARQQAGVWTVVNRALTGRRVTTVIAREGVILAGTTQGLFRSDDLGINWQAASEGLTALHIRWLAYHPDLSDREFAGTEPAGIFLSRDGAKTWVECPEVAQMRDQHQWFLPYSPESGCVRAFAALGNRVYAAVEVGGMLRSDDHGSSWQLAKGSDGLPRFGAVQPGFIHPDVHSVEIHPSSADLVYAPTGGGFYVSSDGGDSWEQRYPPCYCRAVWVDPSDPQHLVLGPADSVDRNGRIEETLNGGRDWRVLSNGLAAPWPRHMVERFVQIDSQLFAILSNGHLLTSAINEWQWQRLLPTVSTVRGLAAMA